MMGYFLWVFVCLFLTHDFLLNGSLAGSLVMGSAPKDLPVDAHFAHRDWDLFRIYFYNDNYWGYDQDRHEWLPVDKPFDVEYMALKGGKWVKVIPENSMMIP